jgi:hypothetical protein
MSDQIGFTILSYNTEKNTLLVRPYSPLFKKAPTEYDYYNISFSNIDENKDINLQIATLLKPIIDDIIKGENPDTQNTIQTFIANSLNITNMVDLTSIATIVPTVSTLQNATFTNNTNLSTVAAITNLFEVIS